MGEYKRTKEHKNSNASGIYCITNLNNNKKYIGQTYDLKYRWTSHINSLKANRHHNRHLQSAWNKYGEDNFKFEVIEYCNVECLDEREIFWIDYYNTLNDGYNLADGGLGCRGYKHTNEEIEKMRKIQNPKAVLQLDKDLNIVAEWSSASHAMKELGYPSRRVIENVCQRIKCQKTYKGYIWVYKEDYENNIIPWDYYLIIKGVSKKINQYDLQMNLIATYDSVTECSNATNIPCSQISAVCNNRRKTAHKYIFKFVI